MDASEKAASVPAAHVVPASPPTVTLPSGTGLGPKLFGTTTVVQGTDVTDEGEKGGISILLFPTPTTDKLDPLNFSKLQKYSALSIVCAKYFLFTYITTTTVATLPAIQEQYGLSIDQANWTLALPALGLAVGPLFWSSPAETFGRRIVFLIGSIISFVATIGAAVAPNYAGYMASRFFQGFGVSPAANVGLAIINDLFFEHERGRVLGLWVLAIDMGLLVGPLIGGFIQLVSVAWVQWLTAIFFGVLFLAELAFLPETLYPRDAVLAMGVLRTGADPEKTEGGVSVESLPRRTRELPFLNYKPVAAIKHPKPWDAAVRFLRTWAYPNVSVAVFFYCFLWYWWVLTIITEQPAAYAQYAPQIQGLLFLGLILGTLVAELFFSGSLSDKIVVKLSMKNGGVRTSGMRLWLLYPAVTISSVGIILWGISVDKCYHWIVGQIAFFLFAFGLQIGNTVVSTYIIDCYPNNAMTCVTFYAVVLNFSAFVSPFFIAIWVEASGFTLSFAAQGIITFFGTLAVFVPLHMFGDKWLAAKPSFPWSDGGL